MFLKSAKDLVNEPSLEGELAIKGRIFTVVNQKKHYSFFYLDRNVK
jgi:hypothetical protein